jgi:hypothetical protein
MVGGPAFVENFLIVSGASISLELLAVASRTRHKAARALFNKERKMIRNYKGFGLALMALLAFGAIVAQGASAVPLTVEGIAKGSQVFIQGTTDKEGEKHIFKSSGNVECSHAEYTAAPVVGEGGAVNEVTLAPEYKNCVAFGFAGTDIKVNGCTYTLTTPTLIVTGEVTWHPSQIHVLCPAGKKIEVTPTSFGVSVCTQSIGEQTPTAGHIVARNAGTPTAMDVTDEATVQGLSYTGTGSACGTAGVNAEYTGKTTVKCYSNAAHTVQVGCTFS